MFFFICFCALSTSVPVLVLVGSGARWRLELGLSKEEKGKLLFSPEPSVADGSELQASAMATPAQTVLTPCLPGQSPQ